MEGGVSLEPRITQNQCSPCEQLRTSPIHRVPLHTRWRVSPVPLQEMVSRSPRRLIQPPRGASRSGQPTAETRTSMTMTQHCNHGQPVGCFTEPLNRFEYKLTHIIPTQLDLHSLPVCRHFIQCNSTDRLSQKVSVWALFFGRAKK